MTASWVTAPRPGQRKLRPGPKAGLWSGESVLCVCVCVRHRSGLQPRSEPSPLTAPLSRRREGGGEDGPMNPGRLLRRSSTCYKSTHAGFTHTLKKNGHKSQTHKYLGVPALKPKHCLLINHDEYVCFCQVRLNLVAPPLWVQGEHFSVDIHCPLRMNPNHLITLLQAPLCNK